jgi:hypothetical protein
MEFTDIPTEQTTFVTDVILALLALGFVLLLYSIGRRHDLKKTRIWSWAFGLLSLSAALGAIAHGIKMSAQTNKIIWQPIYLALGLTIALFVIGVIYDIRGYNIPRLLIPIALLTGTAFYIITVIVPGTFIVFILYEAIAMIFALAAYLWLAIRKKLKGSWLMAIGILITIIAAGVQASGAISITFIWKFDNNGIFHIIQMIALIFLLFGIRAELFSRRV